MQKFQFFRRLILALLVIACSLPAQGYRIYELYTSNQFVEIERMLEEDMIHQQDWKKFCETLFSEDFDLALKDYISIYNTSSDQQLKKLVIDRISQYYYAKGLYDSADRIINDAKFRDKLFSMTVERISFGIQLGAFSTHENALRGKNKYSENLDDIKIIKKSSGGKTLFVIVSGEFDNKKKAEEYLKTVMQKYGYKGIIIQY